MNGECYSGRTFFSGKGGREFWGLSIRQDYTRFGRVAV